MFRGCHRLVFSLACAFCISSMLFLDTLEVKAYNNSSYYTLNLTLTITVYPDNSTSSNGSMTGTFSGSETGSMQGFNGAANITGSVSTYGTLNANTNITDVTAGIRSSSSGTITLSSSSGGSVTSTGNLHLRVPMFVYDTAYNLRDTDSSFSSNKIYMYNLRSLNTGSVTTTSSVSGYSINGLTYYHYDGNIILPGADYNVYGRSFIHNDGSKYYPAVKGYYEFDLSWKQSGSDAVTFTIPLSHSFRFRYNLSDAELSNNSHIVNNPSSDRLQQENNNLQQEQNQQEKSFFDGFFDNLLHIFVPEDGYFSQWFNRVNSLLSDKLGMLYAPFDLVITTLQAIYTADNTESGIPFPGIQWEDTWLIEPFTFTFASLGNAFDDLRDKVYFATDTVLVLTFLMLLQSKVKLILEGHE